MMASMSPMPSQIDLYEEISVLSSRMATAAQAHDWDSLIELECRVAALRNTLLSFNDSEVSASDIERKRTLIQQILQDDAEIRRHTEPWMEHVRQYLGVANCRQRLARAYGAT